MAAKIYLSAPDIGSQELERVTAAFESNWIAPLGPEVDGFEADLANYCGVPHAACVSSGTAALHLALKLLEVGPGDQVLVPSFTFVATASPILYCGAVPVFVDSELSTWNIGPEYLAEAIEVVTAKGRKPKAVISVDLYGNMADYSRVENICTRNQLPLVEDAAEALGSSYKGRLAGSFGTLGILSFNGNKIITTSGGGALLGSSNELLKRARFLSTQARDPAPHYQHSQVGFNYRMSNILAAIGRGQLAAIEEKVAARRRNFEKYRHHLSPLGIEFLPEPSGTRYNRWLTTVLFPESIFPEGTRERVRKHLETINIESRPLWKPLHLQPLFKGCKFFGPGNVVKLFEIGLCLPSGSGLRLDEIDRVIEGVTKVVSRNA